MSTSKLAELAAFDAVVRHGGFSAAARASGLSTGAVSRRLQALEARLGVPLLQRSTRRVSLTDAGRDYHARIAPLLEQLQSADDALRDTQGAPRGPLRVSVPAHFGQLHVMPVLGQFMRRWPQIELDVQFDDRYVDLIAEGFDLAVRVGALGDSRLVARRLADTRRMLVAAPAYLARHGHPRHPRELATHQCLAYTLFRDSDDWTLSRGRERQRVAVRGPLRSNHGAPLVQAAIDGMGIVQTASFVVADALADGRLVEVLRDWSPTPIGIHVVFPRRTLRPRKVDLFADFLGEAIGTPARWS